MIYASRFITHLFATLVAVSTALPAVAQSTQEGGKGCVILMHGLARSKASMWVMASALRAQGYEVVNHNYPSRSAPLGPLAEEAFTTARAGCASDPAPAVVTHSMGGILLRVYAEAHPEAEWDRVVMLGPPNQGSGIIDAYEDIEVFQRLNGPAGLQLGTDGVPSDLPPLPFEAGIIAGNQSVNPITSASVEGDNDGKVSVESTKVEGMAAHLTLPVTHTFMMNNPRVIAQTILFLETGAFEVGMTMADAVERLAE
ncbi:esterase/lipase family protein [Celeribacter sp.]|uniref:esterase/lipase family protein n=1 Tax=Celeribacter sp. TaxID=1890673 RepID=UPI003A920F34